MRRVVLLRCTRSPLSGDNLSTFSIFNQVITFPSLNFSIPHSPPFQFYTLQSPTSCQVQDSSPFSSITSHFKPIAITLIFQFVSLTFPFNAVSLLTNSFHPQLPCSGDEMYDVEGKGDKFMPFHRAGYDTKTGQVVKL